MKVDGFLHQNQLSWTSDNQSQYDKIKTEMLSKLLSHRIRHSERQMTNIKLTSKGPRASHGPTIRQIL